MNRIAEMTHEIVPETLMALLDGEVSGRELAIVQQHVEGCVACRQLINGFKGIGAGLNAWSVGEFSEQAEQEVLIAAQGAGGNEGKRPRWTRKRWSVVLAGCGALLLVWIGLSSSRMGDVLHKPSANALGYSDSRNAGLQVSTGASTDEKARVAYSYAKQAAGLQEAVVQRREQAALSENLEVSPEDRVSVRAVGGGTAAIPNISPMIARTVSLVIVTKEFAKARASMDAILAKHHGYAAELTVSTEQNAPRAVQASLRIPAGELLPALTELKGLGEVQTESQSGEEVTQQHADLVARLKNSKETEQRLQAILQQRTGKISDVLEVEQEIARVRGEIEQMESEQKTLEHRVDFATVDLKLNEEYRAALSDPSPSVITRLRNAGVSGFREAFETLLGIALFFVERGPSLVLWAMILVLPLRFVWKRRRQLFFGDRGFVKTT